MHVLVAGLGGKTGDKLNACKLIPSCVFAEWIYDDCHNAVEAASRLESLLEPAVTSCVCSAVLRSCVSGIPFESEVIFLWVWILDFAATATGLIYDVCCTTLKVFASAPALPA